MESNTKFNLKFVGFNLLLFTTLFCSAGDDVKKMKMLFAEQKDVREIWGNPTFDANCLKYMGNAMGLPNRIFPLAAVTEEDGGYIFYGQVTESNGAWHLYRARTLDGYMFIDVELVHAEGPLAPDGEGWLSYATMCQRKNDGHLFYYQWARNETKLWAFKSSDGITWSCHKKPVVKGHDAHSVFWDHATGKFIFYQATFTKTKKPFPDNIGKTYKRVMGIRTSLDGLSWSPDVRFTDEMSLIKPDEEDPEDLEFYKFFVFKQNDLYIGMQLNYSASPSQGNTHFRIVKSRNPNLEAGHAPFLSNEWWVSDDGFNWRRPFRHVFASGEAFNSGDGSTMMMSISHDPMRIGNDLLWTNGDEVYGLPNERLFCIRSLSNAAFSTQPFKISSLMSFFALNAEIGYDGNVNRGMRGQGYIMVEVLDENGEVLDGFDREGCVIYNLNIPTRQIELDRYGGVLLDWYGKPLSILSGRTVSLRFHFRDARIYDLRWLERRSGK